MPSPLVQLPSKPPSRNRAGFSLVEVLTVVALISVLAGIGSISVKGNAGASRLGTASARCANLFESARETAILRKTPVAVGIFPGNALSPVALTAFEYQSATQSWSRISQWEKMPVGVIFDPTVSTNVNSGLIENSPQVSPALPATDYSGETRLPGVSGGYAYLVFLPSGALLQQHSRPGLLRFVEGTGGEQEISQTGSPENFVDLVVNPATGRMKIIRPH